MTRTKIFASVFVIIALTAVVAFGQKSQFTQTLFGFGEVGLFKFEPQPVALNHQKSEIPESKVYELLFRLVERFETRAKNQKREGNLSRDNLLRNYFQRKFQLSNQQTEILKSTSKDFLRNVKMLRNRAEEIAEAKKLGRNDNSLALKFSGLEKKRQQLSLVYRNRLQEIFGLPEFEKFANLVQENLAAKMTYQVVSESAAFFGYSEVFYDEPAQEVYGYSITELDSGLGCGGEWFTSQCLAAEVDAVFTSDINGQIDSGYDYECLGTAEVDFYISGVDDPSETFCIQGTHEVYQDDYCGGEPLFGKNIWRESNFSNVSEDCVTTPTQPEVTGVGFELIATDSLPIDENPNAGDGLRIFPDDNTPNDTTNRRRIRVRAGLSENRAGEIIYFRNFDLDDPSNDATIDPNGNTGNDNNGTPQAGQLHTTSATTNSNGEATVEFSVTMQPGDNFAIAASTNLDELNAVTVNGMELRTGSGATIDVNCDGTDAVCRSEMLTVWRRLYIEADSMGEVQNNFVDGTFAGNYTVGTSDTVVQVNPQSLETGRFEGGRLVSDSTILQVTTNTANTLTVRSSFGMVTVNQGDSFRLYDDDDFNDDDTGALNGDTGDEIPRPDTSLLSISDVETFNVFAPAYIRPAQRPTGGKNENVPFAANTGETEITNLFNTYFDNQATEADVEFWTVYLLGGYQFRTDRDGDPYTLNRRGELITVWGAADTGERQTVGRGAILFTEDGRPREYPSDWMSRPISRAHTVAHEVGHLFGCIHADGGLMADTTRRTSGSLPPPCLNQIRRNATHP